MITLIEALNYRCLRYIRQPLGPFHVLVGPNASGKSVFLDVLLFLKDFFREGLETAINKRTRTRNFFDLVWGREGDFFELALEIKIPQSYFDSNEEIFDSNEEIIETKTVPELDTIRYELRIKFNQDLGVVIDDERGYIKKNSHSSYIEKDIPNTLLKEKINSKTTYLKREKDTPYYYPYYGTESSELDKKDNKLQHSFFKPDSRISNRTIFDIHHSEKMASTFLWIRDYIKFEIYLFLPENELLKNPSPAGPSGYLKTDYSNICLVIEQLQKRFPELFNEWILHLQTALPDFDTIRLVDRPEERSLYMMLRYKNGLEVPSWLVSEGTLRLIALTLPVYLPEMKGVYMFEEPENGIHPLAIDTVLQSFQSFYDGQVFITTHYPALLSRVDVDQILCFTRTLENGTKIVKGSEHPALQDWKKNVSIGSLFASGVLGQ